MKISTTGRYAIIAMIDLAGHSQIHPISLPQIAGRQNISQHYLQKLFVKMRWAKLVKSTRGPRGGYVLARPPSQLTIKDILSSVDEKIRLVDFGGDDSSAPPNPAVYGSRQLWRKLEATIDRTLTETTLEEICTVLGTERGEVKIPDFQVFT
ncbi:MAG: Rrf2 family transcriptional regulator [Nitrospinota bacterium]